MITLVSIIIVRNCAGTSNMKRKISIILYVALIFCLASTSAVFAAKKIPAKKVTLAPKTMVLMAGDIAQLNATKTPANSTDKLIWSTSNKAVATVSSKGMVQGIRAGNAIITVKTSSNKKAACKVVVKKYVDEASLRESIKQELQEEFATKNDVQTLISQNTYAKDDLDAKFDLIIGDLNSLKTNSYTKSEIDNKINTITSDISSIKDDVKALKQNTYTKSEIDAMISGSGSDWADGTSLTCMNERSLPLTETYNHRCRDENYSVTVTINSISCKKYKIMDYVDDYSYFVPYRYDFTVSYSVEGYDELYQAYQAYIDSHEWDEWDGPPFCPDPPFVDISFIGGEGAGTQLENNNTSMSFSSYGNSDHDAFYIKGIEFDT